MLVDYLEAYMHFLSTTILEEICFSCDKLRGLSLNYMINHSLSFKFNTAKSPNKIRELVVSDF